MQHNKELSQYRLEQAERCLKSAKTLLLDEDFKGSANRCYYCVFHSMRSVLALENIDFKSHSAVIAHFRKGYIKTKYVDVLLSEILADLSQIRTGSDYNDYYIISKEDVEEQIESTEYFLEQIKKYLKNINNQDALP